MKILLPLCPDQDLPALRPYAERVELYAGFMDGAWAERFGAGAGLNRMSSFGGGANFPSFSALRTAMAEAAALGIPVSVTFNALSYDGEQLDFLEERYLAPLRETAGAGVIVSTAGLCRRASALGLPVSVSTIAGIYNSAAARYYAEAGAKALILPRELELQEMASIMARVPEPAYEVFLMNNGCRFSDAVCMGCHIPRQGGLCQLMDRAEGRLAGSLDREAMQAQRVASAVYHGFFMRNACGLCAIYRLLRMGVSRGKIVGRSEGGRAALKSLRLVLRNLDLAADCGSEAEYFERMDPGPGADTRCAGGFSCYDPEAAFRR